MRSPPGRSSSSGRGVSFRSTGAQAVRCAMPVGGLRRIDFERPFPRPEGLGGSSSFDDLHCKNDAFRGQRQQKQWFLMIEHAQLSKSATGIDGLDAITEGGLPTGRPTLLCGAAGCGKTLFGVTFLVQGAVRFKQPGVLMTFEERPGDISANVESLGYDLPGLIASKSLAIDQVKIERGESEESGDYDLEGLFVRLGHAIELDRRKTSRPGHHRKPVRGAVGCDRPAQRAPPFVCVAQGKRRYRDHHGRTRRGSTDAPRT